MPLVEGPRFRSGCSLTSRLQNSHSPSFAEQGKLLHGSTGLNPSQALPIPCGAPVDHLAGAPQLSLRHGMKFSALKLTCVNFAQKILSRLKFSVTRVKLRRKKTASWRFVVRHGSGSLKLQWQGVAFPWKGAIHHAVELIPGVGRSHEAHRRVNVSAQCRVTNVIRQPLVML